LGIKLYMFRTVPFSIIRSFSLYTHQWYMSYRFADSLRAGSGRSFWSCSQAVWHIPLLCLQWKTPDDGKRNCPKHVEFYSKNKFEKLGHLFGFIIRIYRHALSPERQIKNQVNYFTVCSVKTHIAHFRQQCHNSKSVIFQEKLLKFLKCHNFLWVQRRHNCSPAASFCKLRLDTIPVESASGNVSFCTSNSKMPNFELWHSCRKWGIQS